MNLPTISSPDPTVLIYRDDLLGYSETFIADQAKALRRFRPTLVGIRTVPGLAVANGTLLAKAGRFKRFHRIVTKLAGPARSRVSELAALDPTLIHAHFLIDAATAGQLAEALHIPMIVSVHGYDATVSDVGLLNMGLAERTYLLRRSSVIRRASQFLCVSHYLRGQLLAKGFPRDKLAVHYTGTDTEFFSPIPTSERLSSRVLFVGRLVEKKGCEYLIRAMEIVQERVPNAALTVIGDGPLRPALEALARTKLHSFQFLGSQPREVVKTHMNVSRLFCVPSVIDRSGGAEGFGMVFTEAQAMGLPVVSFATGGIPEAVEHGKTGLLAHERDHRQLAKFIEALLTNQSRWRQMSENGQARVRQMFDIKRQTAKLEQIYAHFSRLPGREVVTPFDLQAACAR